MKKFIEKKLWTTLEDNELKDLVQFYGINDWPTIARFIINRTSKQCRERWKTKFNPNILKGNWRVEEDELILQLYASIGSRWRIMTQSVTGRSEHDIRNRYFTLDRNRTLNKEASSNKNHDDPLAISIKNNRFKSDMNNLILRDDKKSDGKILDSSSNGQYEIELESIDSCIGSKAAAVTSGDSSITDDDKMVIPSNYPKLRKKHYEVFNPSIKSSSSSSSGSSSSSSSFDEYSQISDRKVRKNTTQRLESGLNSTDSIKADRPNILPVLGKNQTTLSTQTSQTNHSNNTVTLLDGGSSISAGDRASNTTNTRSDVTSTTTSTDILQLVRPLHLQDPFFIIRARDNQVINFYTNSWNPGIVNVRDNFGIHILPSFVISLQKDQRDTIL